MEKKEILSTTLPYVDENDATAVTKNVKKMIVVNKEPTERATLGVLQNSAAGPPNNTNKEAASKNLNRAKLQNIKLRVDSHWTKPIGTTATTKPNSITTAAAAVEVSTVLTQSNSVRTASNTDAAALQPKGSNVVVNEKPKTLAAVENKVPEANAAKQMLNAERVVLVKKKRIYPVESTDCSSSNEDVKHLLSVSEYVNDIYEYLYQLEEKFPIRPSYMENHAEINGSMRDIVVDWINEVHDQFRLIAETFQLAVAIIDRYLQAVPNTKRSELQLVGVTALLLAAKFEELYPPAIVDLIYITDDMCDGRQIRQMELKIFGTLDCNLSRPLPIHFLKYFSKAADAGDCYHILAQYFLELSMTVSDMAHYKPSQIAAASLFLTLNLLNGNSELPSGLNDKYWTPTLQSCTSYKANDLKAIVRGIATTARNARTAKLKAVYAKYQSSKFQEISTRPELYGPLMDSIVGN